MPNCQILKEVYAMSEEVRMVFRVEPELRAGFADTALKRKNMRTIGHRKEHPVTFSASAVLLAEGARFNDEIHRLPTGDTTHIPKGVYRFKSFEEADRHRQDCLVAGMVRIAMERT
jgi:hypothetical protein